MTIKRTSPFILASASPRRRQLLAEAGYEFAVVPPDIDESTFSTDQIAPCKYAEQLALAKAKSVAQKYPDNLVIGADTIVDCRGEIIGKPRDAEEAGRIIQKLFGEPHKVITGLAFCRARDGVEIVTSDSTTVFPKQLTQDQIDGHIESGRWKDMSGAYAIKENGDEFIERIEGSLTNVMGLPMELLERILCRIEV